ncbi:MAG: serine protease SohB [Polaribacter sp.]
MEFLAEYGIFLAKTVTIVVAIIIVIGSIAALSSRNKKTTEGHIEITNISEDLADIKEGMLEELLSEEEYKVLQKEKKKTDKAEKKVKEKKLKTEKKLAKINTEKVAIKNDDSIESASETDEELEINKSAENVENKDKEDKESHRVFVINFDGDVEASAVENLREEITAIISIAEPKDEVVVNLESPGGMVHSYGLAASQLTRIKAANLKLIIVVDQVAASGGYMMACVADEILAAPFAIVGSIGVVAEIPNFHRLLKHNKVDYEQHTAGEFKRTLTMFSENTDVARKKFKQELEETHDLFKEFITKNRPALDIDKVATGEHWYGTQALDLGLIDGIMTSDDYIVKASEKNQVFEIAYQIKKPFSERFAFSVQSAIEKSLLSVWQKSIESRLFK